MRKRFTSTIAAAVTMTLLACGSDGGTGPDGGGGNNSMSAVVDGSTFAPPAQAVQGTFVSGVLNFAGSSTVAGVTTMVSINLVEVDGPGSYDITPSFSAQFGQVTRSGGASNVSSWGTLLSPGTGEVTINTLTEDHASGSFHFTGQHLPGTAATGQMTVNSGTFDIHF